MLKVIKAVHLVH